LQQKPSTHKPVVHWSCELHATPPPCFEAQVWAAVQ
jgi:hypothetical protein